MLISDLPKVMCISLLCTLIIEVSIAFILQYRKKDLLNVLLVNVLTNPLLNSSVIAINYFYGLKARNISLYIFEVLVILTEGFIYNKYLERKKINGYLLSLILNIASYVIGLLINKIIYWKEFVWKRLNY